MALDDTTYVFRNDKVYALTNGKVVAAASDIDELEDELAKKEEDDAKKASSVVETPGGLKGKILGRTPDLWGLSETLTVRLENGRIAHYKVADTTPVIEEETALITPVGRFQSILHEAAVDGKDGLLERKEILASLKKEASGIASKGASDDDLMQLNQIIVQADNEIGEIDQQLDHIQQAEDDAFEGVAPYGINVVEQGGRADGAGWLDHTLNDMIEEAEGQDFDKLLSEGPEALVAEQDSSALGDQGAMQAIAEPFVSSKVAAASSDIREKFTKAFLARVEEVRREELASRKEADKKEASRREASHEDSDDAGLFL